MSPFLPIAAAAALLFIMRSGKKPARAQPPAPPPPGPDGYGEPGADDVPADGSGGGGINLPDPEGKGPGKIRPQGGRFPGPQGKPQGEPDIVIYNAVFHWPDANGKPADTGTTDGDPSFEPAPIEWIKTLATNNEEHDVLLATGIPKGNWLVNLRFSMHTQSMPDIGQVELLTYHLHITNAGATLELAGTKYVGLYAQPTANMFGCTSLANCTIDRDGYKSFFQPALRWAHGGLELSFMTRKFATGFNHPIWRAHARLELQRGGA